MEKQFIKNGLDANDLMLLEKLLDEANINQQTMILLMLEKVVNDFRKKHDALYREEV